MRTLSLWITWVITRAFQPVLAADHPFKGSRMPTFAQWKRNGTPLLVHFGYAIVLSVVFSAFFLTLLL